MPVFHDRILVDRPKRWISKQASESLKSAKRGVTQNVHAVSNALQSATSEAREHVSHLDGPFYYCCSPFGLPANPPRSA